MFLIKLLIILCFTVFQVTDSTKFIPRDEVFIKANICTGQGLMCSHDCTAVLYCQDKVLWPIRAHYCDYYEKKNKKCFSNYTAHATCDTKSDCELANRGTFQCYEDGEFPDPFLCRRSYKCSKNNLDYTSHCLCGLGSVWISPTECTTDEKAIQACCRDFEVDCKNKRGDNFGEHCPLTALGYYYTCNTTAKDLTVSTHRCPKNQIFNKSSFKCEVGLFLFSNSTTAAVSTTSTNVTVTKRSVKLAPPEVPYCFKKSK